MPKISQIDEVPCQAEVRILQTITLKNSVSVSDDQCLQYVRKQCVSSEDIIFTVHIGYDCLRCLHGAKQERLLQEPCCSYVFFLLDVL